MKLCMINVNVYEEFEMGFEEIQMGLFILYDDEKKRKKSIFGNFLNLHYAFIGLIDG